MTSNVLTKYERTSDKNYVIPHNNNRRGLETIGLQLFFTQAPLMAAVRLPCRVISLLSGDFFRAGKAIGNEQWELTTLKTNSKQNRNYYIAKETLKQLIINIVQIATYPLAIIALQFAALALIITPESGRKLWGTIEHYWSRNENLSPKKICGIIVSEYLDYMAPCMQPKEIWEKRNIYPIVRCDDIPPEEKRKMTPKEIETAYKEINKHDQIRQNLLFLRNYCNKYMTTLPKEGDQKEEADRSIRDLRCAFERVLYCQEHISTELRNAMHGQYDLRKLSRANILANNLNSSNRLKSAIVTLVEIHLKTLEATSDETRTPLEGQKKDPMATITSAWIASGGRS